MSFFPSGQRHVASAPPALGCEVWGFRSPDLTRTSTQVEHGPTTTIAAQFFKTITCADQVCSNVSQPDRVEHAYSAGLDPARASSPPGSGTSSAPPQP
eukprot:CAMPEP_0180149462 /NCGR_PEP_ID=MMETSP0986-20121125/20813_1 /TAXON_ID=697907 /ORGANISM="non described non described, Strain CCMP2293" /LENGTH=97 /DNA_ID=CAMNT_0022096101 /DNA_START=39 /DNA_END=332 /DNA_ORIENTATION=+